MKSVRIFQLKGLSKKTSLQIRAGQLEAGLAWTSCVELHKKARSEKLPWPNRDVLQKHLKGNFALHSQSLQMIAHTFLANIDTTTKIRRENKKIRYPYKEKRFYALMWPEQAVCQQKSCIILPMGRGRKSLVLPVLADEKLGACKIVWNDGYELHAVIEKESTSYVGEQSIHATVDLGEIHLAAVSTNTGKSLVVSGRGIRSLKRLKSKKDPGRWRTQPRPSCRRTRGAHR